MKTVFVTNQFGAKVLFDEKGLIGKFKNSNNNIIKSDDGILRRSATTPNLWYMVLDDEDKIERAKRYPGYGIMFSESKNEPVFNTLGNLRTLSDPNAGVPNGKTIIPADEVKGDASIGFEEYRKQMAKDSRRYGDLFSEICKAGGEYIKGANPQLIAEFEQLQIKLGVIEKPQEVIVD
jgi:hypothetical protein